MAEKKAAPKAKKALKGAKKVGNTKLMGASGIKPW